MDISCEFDRDDIWLREIADAIAATSDVPARYADIARESFTWRLVDEELETMALCFDSAVDAQVVVRAASVDGPRSLSFESDRVGLDIEVRADQIVGLLSRPRCGVLRLRGADGTCRTTTSDELGWFSFERSQSGPQRLECDVDGSRVVTEWTNL